MAKRHEVLRVLEEADLLVTAAIAGKWPLERLQNEWRKFLGTVERRYEPDKFVNHFASGFEYTVREITGDEKDDTVINKTDSKRRE